MPQEMSQENPDRANNAVGRCAKYIGFSASQVGAVAAQLNLGLVELSATTLRLSEGADENELSTAASYLSSASQLIASASRLIADASVLGLRVSQRLSAPIPEIGPSIPVKRSFRGPPTSSSQFTGELALEVLTKCPVAQTVLDYLRVKDASALSATCKALRAHYKAINSGEAKSLLRESNVSLAVSKGYTRVMMDILHSQEDNTTKCAFYGTAVVRACVSHRYSTADAVLADFRACGGEQYDIDNIDVGDAVLQLVRSNDIEALGILEWVLPVSTHAALTRRDQSCNLVAEASAAGVAVSQWVLRRSPLSLRRQ